jgi:F-type H+-transporting ATPase subunit gamma
MTERLADIVTDIQSVRQLDAVVTAMRGIAASRAQNGRSLLAGIEAYTDVVSAAIGKALGLLPLGSATAPVHRRAKLGLILFCAEQGFAGAFSERVLDAASADLTSAVNLVIGTRGVAIASERGVKPAFTAAMVTHVDAIAGFANRLADALYAYIAAGRVERADILFSRWSPASGIVVDRHSLLPLDFGRFVRPLEAQPPMTNLAASVLVERLAAEYVFAQLCQATTNAFEAENEARTLAMASARSNIETKLTALRQRESRLRQEEITTEIVELAAGSEATKRRDGARGSIAELR